MFRVPGEKPTASVPPAIVKEPLIVPPPIIMPALIVTLPFTLPLFICVCPLFCTRPAENVVAAAKNQGCRC